MDSIGFLSSLACLTALFKSSFHTTKATCVQFKLFQLYGSKSVTNSVTNIKC